MPAKPVAPIVRIMRKVVVSDSGCWLYGGAISDQGYGRVWDSSTRSLGYAHRFTYATHRGPVPAGHELDHLCRVRACCNPDHLEAVPHRTNVCRSPTAAPSINAARTHCVNGHEFTAENTYRRPDRVAPTRNCRTCQREREVARKLRGVADSTAEPSAALEPRLAGTPGQIDG